MAKTKLVIILEVDEDPTLVDPHDIAEALLEDMGGYELVAAEWEGTATLSAVLDLEGIS